MRSYSMRSKLLSLHLILTILTSHMRVFTSPGVVFSVIDSSSKRRSNPFILEVKQYLCPSLGRNAFSMVPQVFDITMEILWKVIQGLKAFLKVIYIIYIFYIPSTNIDYISIYLFIL